MRLAMAYLHGGPPAREKWRPFIDIQAMLFGTTPLRTISLLVTTALASGCAVSYYDQNKGVEHLWGFGHMRLLVQQPKEDVRAIVTSQETVGFSTGTTSNGGHLSLGWHDERRILVTGKDTKIRFEWPSADFFDIRVGSEPPFLKHVPATHQE